MRFNEREIAFIASKPAEKEGRLSHKNPGFREVYKERWFKVKGNLLFYYRLNEYGAVYEKEPVGVLVIEQCRIQPELYTELAFSFSITFANDLERRHYFGCPTQRHRDEWIKILQESSYEYQRTRLTELREQLLQKTGKDPLAAVSLKSENFNTEEDDSDIFFTRLHPASKTTQVPDLLL